jgi:serine/threonine-protein kinase RsbW
VPAAAAIGEEKALLDRTRTDAFSIRSDPARIRDARKWVAAIARSAGFTEEETHDLTVALNEVCSNSHRHSYCGRKDGRIDLEAEADEERVRITVRDYGVAFAPSDREKPLPSEPGEGGYGLHLIRSLTDEVRYTDMGVGTRVVLVKKRRPGRQETS